MEKWSKGRLLKWFIVTLGLAFLLLISVQGVEAGGSGDYPPPIVGDWTISTPTSVFDEVLELRGSVVLVSGGSLDLDNAVLVMNSSFEGQYHIEVQDGGELDAHATKFTPLNMSDPYYLVVREGGKLRVTNSTLEGMGWDGATSYEQMGLAIYSNDSRISNSLLQENHVAVYLHTASAILDDDLITDNFYGVWAKDSGPLMLRRNNITHNNVGLVAESSIVVLDNCTLPDNNLKGVTALSSTITLINTSIQRTREIGLSGLDSNITMVNGSLEGDTYGLVLDQNSSMKSLNGSIDRYDIIFKDWSSSLTVYWNIDIRALWWSDLAPVANASVDVRDVSNVSIANGTTGSKGVLRTLLVPGYDADRARFVFHSPIDVLANASGLLGNTTSNLDGPTTISVIIDDIAPGINVTSPPLGGYVNEALVNFSGVLWDNETGPSHVEISIDAGSLIKANGTVIWNISVNLSEGFHVITFFAFDLAGNSLTLVTNITIDTIAPRISIGSPKDGYVTRLSRIWVNGTAEAGANLTMGNLSLNNTNGTFGLFIDLEEGKNPITIRAVDKAGNEMFAALAVIKDTMVDPLVLDPRNGTSTNMANLTIKGTTEPGTVISVRWTSIEWIGNNTTLVQHNISKIANLDGNFSFYVILSESENLLSLIAKDTLNNTVGINLTYYLDSTPPRLEMTSPSSRVHYTNRNGVNIKGETEEGARVYLGNQELQLYDLRFSIRVEVYLGLNNFSLWAVDPAGNVNGINITIIVDKVSPGLNISRPFEPIVKHAGGYFVITGFTESNATVYINKVKYDVRSDGYFAIRRSLAFGKNRFTITAKDQAGNPTSIDRIIIRVKAPPDMTSTYILWSVALAVPIVFLIAALIILNKKGKLKRVKRLFWSKGGDGPDETEDDLPPPLPDDGMEGLDMSELPLPDISSDDDAVELEKGGVSEEDAKKDGGEEG